MCTVLKSRDIKDLVRDRICRDARIRSLFTTQDRHAEDYARFRGLRGFFEDYAGLRGSRDHEDLVVFCMFRNLRKKAAGFGPPPLQATIGLLISGCVCSGR